MANNQNTNTVKEGTIGAEIANLVAEHTGSELGLYILERAAEQVRENNRKIAEFKQTLLPTVEAKPKQATK